MKYIKNIATIVSLLMLTISEVCAQPLDTLLQNVVEGNLDLKRLQLEYEIELSKKNQVNQLPNPQLAFGIPVSQPETRLGPQMTMVSLSQMFPWFGTLKSKEDVVIAISKAKYEKLAALKLDLFHTIKSSYYQLYFLQKKRSVIEDNIKLYESIESVAMAKFESAQSSAADVLRVQSKLLAMRQELQLIENQRKPFEAKINELAKRPYDSTIVVDDKLGDTKTIFNIEAYRISIGKYHPLITQIDFQIEASKKRIELNNNLNNPTIGVGIDYSLVSRRTDANPKFNGRDILVPKVMVSVPIYRKSFKAKKTEEELTQLSLELKKESIADRMVSLLVKYKKDYDNAKILEDLALNQAKIVNSAYEVLVTQYSSTGNGFEELLVVQNQLLNFSLEIYREKLASNLASINIERITNF